MKDHQVCLAHLIREAQYAIDAGDSVFAPRPAQTTNPTCAIGGVGYRQINALAEKLALHFLRGWIGRVWQHLRTRRGGGRQWAQPAGPDVLDDNGEHREIFRPELAH
jgi:hypothetical protein